MFYGKCITPVPSPQHCASAHSQGCVPNRAIRAVLYFESVFAGQTEKKKKITSHMSVDKGGEMHSATERSCIIHSSES